MADPQTIARVARLSYRYAPNEPDVLCDVSLDIREAEIVALTGPSGSGKTTLLSLLGLVRRTKPGSIQLFDVDVGAASPAQVAALRRRVRLIFQKHYLLRSLTALQNVMAGVMANPSKDRRSDLERAQTLLDQFGLGNEGDKLPDQLSIGQQQRVATARSLIGLPKLLLADEPTASLDRSSAHLVMDRIVGAARTLQCAVLVSTHDDRILSMASRTIQIRDGRLSCR
jgi:putative ABC transport system ATP-binding protein